MKGLRFKAHYSDSQTASPALQESLLQKGI